MMRQMRIPLLSLLLLCLWAGAAAAQTADQGGPVIYRLDKGSTYQYGCFAPCECPLLEEVSVRGTFVLTPAGSDPLFSHYKVTDVNWTVSLGDPQLRITGSGIYKIGGEVALQQQLELDLKVGNEETQHFDSGLVTGPAPFPVINVTISIHGQYCFDTVIRVNASPVPATEIRPYRLLSESTFQRGCFGPCLCPLFEKEPIRGTFALVPLQRNPLFTEFAVVDVNWLVMTSTDASRTEIPVRGYGTYRFGGEVAAEQQLSLDLTVGDEPLTHFDSGLVPGGQGFPRIDVLISINGVYCYDTLIDVHAAPAARVPAGTPEEARRPPEAESPQPVEANSKDPGTVQTTVVPVICASPSS